MKKKKRRTVRDEGRISARDIIKDILCFFLMVGCTAGYVVLLLLIISFITLSYLHFTIEGILIAGAVSGGIAGVYYIVKMVKKYRAL
ncbi:MAG: hypothetical protein NC254_06860 [bacterium]|nr:hypothetical protein [bacterium]